MPRILSYKDIDKYCGKLLYTGSRKVYEYNANIGLVFKYADDCQGIMNNISEYKITKSYEASDNIGKHSEKKLGTIAKVFEISPCCKWILQERIEGYNPGVRINFTFVD